MAEAYMISLAAELGREHAHDLVYAAVGDVRAGRATLADAVSARLKETGAGHLLAPAGIDPAGYLGEAKDMCAASVAGWNNR